jgi:U3 small nucleolar RNA-associated protein 14
LLAAASSGSAKSSKSGSKKRREDAEEATTSRQDAYSYDDTRSKGRTARRFQTARNDAVQDEGSSRSSKKGKGKARENSEDELDEDDDEGSNDFKSIQDIKGIKFKMGMDSGDEAGAFDEDDEEIDSDLADTDHDEPAPSTSKQKLKNGKRKVRPAEFVTWRGLTDISLQVATDFYDDQAEINLDEDSEDDEGEYMDLSEVLKQNAPSTRKAGLSKEPTEEAHLKSFGPYTSLTNEEGSDAEELDEDEASGSGEGDESDEDDEEMSEAESDDVAALERLQGIISTLPASAKRPGDEISAEDEQDGQARKRRKPLRKERTEAIPESDFAATSSKDGE